MPTLIVAGPGATVADWLGHWKRKAQTLVLQHVHESAFHDLYLDYISDYAGTCLLVAERMVLTRRGQRWDRQFAAEVYQVVDCAGGVCWLAVSTVVHRHCAAGIWASDARAVVCVLAKSSLCGVCDEYIQLCVGACGSTAGVSFSALEGPSGK